MNPRFSLNGHPAPAPSLDDRKRLVVRDLTNEYDSVNRQFPEAEAWLREIPVLHGGYVIIDNDDRPNRQTVLGYLKFQGEWKVLIGGRDPQWPDDECQDFQWKPALDCSMETRLEVVASIDCLKAKILEIAEGLVSLCRSATGDLDI